jgi:hypothetical protein
MSSLDEMSQRIAAYRDGRISLSDFENWFEDNSSAAYAVPELKSVWAAVDAAFSQYHYDHIGEEAMKVELANAILPFVSIPENRCGNPVIVLIAGSNEKPQLNHALALK